MKKLILLIAAFCLSLPTSMGFAHELLVLSGDNSRNSKRWEEEVLPEYASSISGKNLPAKIVRVQGTSFPEWLAQALDDGRIGEILGTPTFIIWDPKTEKEIGRIEGYTQKPRFFSQLDEAVKLVNQGRHPGKREGSRGHRDEGSGGDRRKKEGSGNSGNIMGPIYKTPEEAQKASEMLGLGGEIHSRETADGTIYMPGATM